MLDTNPGLNGTIPSSLFLLSNLRCGVAWPSCERGSGHAAHGSTLFAALVFFAFA